MFHNINLRICEILLSLPSRERGLKYQKESRRDSRGGVAPFAGAWIEISLGIELEIAFPSLPSRERGLKYPPGLAPQLLLRRSLRGSVD